MKTQKKLPGRITIARQMGGSREGHVITIEIEDEASGTRFLDLELTAEDMMLAITGHGAIPVTFTIRAGLVGCVSENKTEEVEFSPYERGAERRIDACLEEFERDGWRGNRSDMTNGHRTVERESKRFQRVNFRRYLRDGVPVLDPTA